MNWKLSQDGLSAYRTLGNGCVESRMVHAIDVDELVSALPADIIIPDYREQRAAEYPPMTDYLDAIVKGDLAQQQAYIDKCLAVKSKYPK
jgi:hypothetical protein